MEGEIDEQHLETKREEDTSGSISTNANTTTPIPETTISQKLLDETEHGSLDENKQMVAQDSGYNSSGSSAQHSPDALPSNHAEDDMVHTRSRASSRTSISSIPASILTNLPDTMKSMHMRETHDYMYQPWDAHSPRAVHTIRQREAFRKPSSVRAMQMHTEDEGDDEFLTPPKRRGGQRISDISIRSAGSSPLKRSPFYSPSGPVSKPKVKKEYPLVLLHCTLLSPSLPVPGLVGHPERQKILREVLPSVYWKRWKLLEEKIGSGVLRDRGVLISHPEDMYDLLEERLLESLELQRPRLDHGHFLGPDETESDREDRLAHEDSCTESEGEECPDCGGRLARHNNIKKWEIKVFAANGLMRAGAWAAAWKEMEKVDVEVGLWLPADIRAELEREMAQGLPQIETSLSVPLLQEPDVTTTTPVRALTPRPSNIEPNSRAIESCEIPSLPTFSQHTLKDNGKADPLAPTSSQDIDLHTLLINYIRVLASDRRNVAIVFLSILVAFGAINSRASAPTLELRPFPGDMPDYAPSSAVPQHTTQTLVEGQSAQILSVTSLEQEIVPAPAAILETIHGLGDDATPQSEASAVELKEPAAITSEEVSGESTQIASEEHVTSEEQAIPEERAISGEEAIPEEQVMSARVEESPTTSVAASLNLQAESTTIPSIENIRDHHDSLEDGRDELSDSTEPTESSEPEQPIDLSQHIDEEDETEPNQPLEPLEPVEPSKDEPNESSGLDEQTEKEGETGLNQPLDSLEPIESTKSSELDEQAEEEDQAGPVNPMKSTEPKLDEPVQPAELNKQNEKNDENDENDENEQT
ncbi:hypothetical protein BJX68DRAFT_161861 [Aspergillus pseudodeflectus]|uniref:Uncharacterized protein n=1 Tax=Aspergillus pseudodeflectus TaxID=176178 RepID=A0ABR4L0W8_9EURO